MAKLYSNENFPQPVVDELRRLGHDVLTSLEAGKANQGVPDDEVIRFATSQGRAVLTLNRRHFHTQHRRSARPTPGSSRPRLTPTIWHSRRASMIV